MPIYDYRCRSCHYEAEFFHGISQELEETCPQCGSADFERLVSAPSVRFAGQGYYETDEKPKNKQRNVVREEKSTSDKAS